MFKIHHGFSQVSCLNLFHNYNENNFYSLRSQPDFQYFGPVLWNNIPIEDT